MSTQNFASLFQMDHYLSPSNRKLNRDPGDRHVVFYSLQKITCKRCIFFEVFVTAQNGRTVH